MSAVSAESGECRGWWAQLGGGERIDDEHRAIHAVRVCSESYSCNESRQWAVEAGSVTRKADSEHESRQCYQESSHSVNHL